MLADGDLPAVKKELEILRTHNAAFSWIGLTDAQGIVIAATDDVTVGRDASSRPWFSGAKSSFYVGNIHDVLMPSEILQPSGGGEPLRFTDYASAVIDSTGQFRGVLAAHASFEWIGDTISRVLTLHELAGTQVWLTDGSGGIHYPTNDLTETIDIHHLLTLDSVQSVPWQGDEMWTIATPVFSEEAPILDWVVVSRPDSVAASHAQTVFSQQLLAVEVGLLTLAGLLAFALLYLVLKPLSRLSVNATLVAGGERSELEPVKTVVHEIQHLADTLRSAFNQIAEQRSALAEHSAVLEREVEARTDELSMSLAQLGHLQKRSAAMYATIAHELRTLVAAIQMMSESGDSAREYVDDIRALSEQLMTTLDDMRLAINPELVQPVRLVETNLPTLADSICLLVAPVVRRTGVDFQYEQGTDPRITLCTWWIDAYRLRIIISNLLKNACLHSEGSGVRFALQLSGDSLLMSIIDNGKGIEPSELQRLLQPFERGTSARSGTGMGLNIAESWLKELGGELSYQRLDPGSQFDVRLPIAEVNIPSQAPQEVLGTRAGGRRSA